MMAAALFEHHTLTNFLTNNQHNNWVGTPIEKYVGLSTKNKGVYGEMAVELHMSNEGCTVRLPENPGHDRIFDDIKTEIKFSVANSPKENRNGPYKGRKMINPDQFTFNHIAEKKDWARLIFCGVNPSLDNPNVLWPHPSAQPPELRMFWMHKADFVRYMAGPNKKSRLFSRQQGGEGGSNDDYMLAGSNKFQKLINLPFVYPIEKWGL